MKEKILKLREEGKSYNEIVEILDCSKSTVSYHCGKGQKEKTMKRQRRRRKNSLIQKVDNFRQRSKSTKGFVESVRKFNKRDNSITHNVNKELDSNFNYKDVINKFGEKTNCYLTGEPIDLCEDIYELDHIIPVSKGGSNRLSNLGITKKEVNKMKGGLTVDELLKLSKKILEYNGYKVTK